MSKRRKGFPSETKVKRGVRIVVSTACGLCNKWLYLGFIR